ncbi:hypothetical protein GIB67_003193 [Kingdonia uniflora]|uniref:HIRAN domain-containing protein n=1 Tax=Kingdonia uniflora TaxID=39325 RepID=A0A7J7L573_9MAGN|nr:hypothetical protein GIB67_003193 [Kingdonia uniflora]
MPKKKCFGMSEVVLRRNTSIPADANAVSVLIGDLDEFSEGDYIQLGFMPKDVAKWVAPLCDAGLFSFSGYILSERSTCSCFGGKQQQSTMILYVSQASCHVTYLCEGRCFFNIICRGTTYQKYRGFLQPEHVASICSLSSMQRCVSLAPRRGASSIGTSMNPQFLAAFSAAAGKRSVQFVDSEESDPEVARRRFQSKTDAHLLDGCTVYKPNDRPATTTAMREALAKLAELEKEILEEADGAGEMMNEEMPDEEEVVEVMNMLQKRKKKKCLR